MTAPAPNTTQPKTRGRWFSFSLRTLLIGIALLAIPLGYVAHEAMIVRERKAFLEFARVHGRAYGEDWYRAVGSSNNLPFVRRLLGDTPMGAICLYNPTKSQEAEFMRLFPESGIEVFGYHDPDDEIERHQESPTR